MRPSSRSARRAVGGAGLTPGVRAGGLAILGAAVTVLLTGCVSGSDPLPCAAAPAEGAVSLWTECGPRSLSEPSIAFVLTNDLGESIHVFHDCQDEQPWLTRLQPDGTWKRLLPEGFSLPISCEHVEEVMPGESRPLAVALRRAEGPGTYRAEMLIAHGCEHVHEPLHFLHSCASNEYLTSASFELR